MNKHVIDIGGELNAGDFIGVAYSNSVEYGWYVPGRESLMFVRVGAPIVHERLFREYQDNVKNGVTVGDYYHRHFKKGLTFKCIGKDFITSWGSNNRVFKVNNPEEFFKGSKKLEKDYHDAKAILHSLNFPAQ